MSCTFESAMPALLNHYDSATPDQLTRGREWYDRARTECRQIARQTGVSYRQAAAVMAITSPDAQLATNVTWTRNACANGGETAGKYPTDQTPKVRAALSDRKNPGQYATGPKVHAFYCAIVGDESVLVIDRWASFAAGGPRDKVPAARDRREIAAAYAAAAVIAGESVRDFQAVVWVVCRESTPKSGSARAPKYRDIHQV